MAQNGDESPIYKLNLEDMSVDTSLEAIYVNGILVEQDENGKYVTTVYDTSPKVDVKAITNNENAYVRISLGQERLHETEEEITLAAEKQTKVPITVRSQSGITKTTTLYINVISTNSKINVTLDGKEPNYYNQASKTYTFIVDNTKENYELFAIAESNYTTLEFEEQEYIASFGEIVYIEHTEDGKTFYIKAKPEAGGMVQYRVDIVRSSDNVDLDFLKVDGAEVYPDGGTGKDKYNYTVIIPKETVGVLIEAQTKHLYASLQIGDNEIVKHYDRGTLDCPDLTQTQIVVPINVIAADGKTRVTYNLTLIRDNAIYIRGRIITENINQEYLSEVTIYKMANPELEGSKDEEFAKVYTKTDGTFSIKMYTEDVDLPEVLEAKYKLVVSKSGYLNYTITDIELEPKKNIQLEEYRLIAGDVIKSGQIEIDDIVNMNEQYGMAVTEANIKFDLNEDGMINELDRNILLGNYTMKSEEISYTEIIKEN